MFKTLDTNILKGMQRVSATARPCVQGTIPGGAPDHTKRQPLWA
jgi:hypothetical protein